MKKKLEIEQEHFKFIINDNDALNIFNILRLMRSYCDENTIEIDVSAIKQELQVLIAYKLPAILNLYNFIHGKKLYAQLFFSNIDENTLNIIEEKFSAIVECDSILLSNDDSKNTASCRTDPHFVKNIRGAALLSLTHDLLSAGSIRKKNFPLFDHRSPINLHSASTFLNNEANAETMWKILHGFENIESQDNLKAINRKIESGHHKKNELQSLTNNVISSLNKGSNHEYFIGLIKTHFALPEHIFTKTTELEIWLVDDQQANGWFELLSNLLSGLKVNIKAFTDIEAVLCQIKLHEIISLRSPDIAFIDLRLLSNEENEKNYNASDLSGFEVVDLLLKKWPSLSIMIASASSKLWNMEKAIEKGAVAYWRKSDESLGCTDYKAILTAFEIHFHFFEKFKVCIERCKFQYVFKVMHSLKAEIHPYRSNLIALTHALDRFDIELEQKVSWMCWTKSSEERVRDSLLLNVMEIFNELENDLFDKSTDALIIDPSVTIQSSSRLEDKKIINKSLEYLDNKYQIRGIDLKSMYESCKSVRNKLPSIHGSEAEKNVKHASVDNIETCLLIIWCLIKELKGLNSR